MQAMIRRFAAQGAMCAKRAAAYATLCAMLAAPAAAQTYQGQGGYQGQGDYQQGQGGGYPGQQGDYQGQGGGNQGQGAYQGQGGGYSQGQAGGGNNRCQELERQLVSDWQSGQMPQDAVVRLDQQLEQLTRDRRRLEGEAERRECYEELFIFGRSLKRTPACIQIDGDLERMRRDIANLRQQRDGMTNSAKRRMRREDLVAELARNGCGENYQREASTQRRRAPSFFSLWEDDSVPFDRGAANTQPEQSNLPFASYRTMCVRLCDGFYFPISFSTLGSRFAEDEAKCKSQCAAPAELFVYKNPGEEIEQAVSLTGSPYTGMKNAFRNRKEFVKGCSCRQEEYSTQQIEQYEQEKGRKQASAPAAAPAQQ